MCVWLPVYTRAEEAMAKTLAVVALVVALAPAPSSLSLALHVDVGRHHHHPVDMEQWSVRAPGDVRCYCNLPACITTGYMCKSAGRGCFSDLVDHVDVYRARHGCLDLLDSGRQRQCKNQPRPGPDEVDDVPAWEQDEDPERDPARDPVVVRDPVRDPTRDVVRDAREFAREAARESARPRLQQDVSSLLLCCHEDMCNHIDSPEARTRHNGPNGSDASHVTMSGPAGVPLGQPGSSEAAAAAAAARSAELWFKAATIAVPICGALILVLLIVLAVRLLRADSQHQRASKLSACAFPPLNDKKVPLLACSAGPALGWGHSVSRLDCPAPAAAKTGYSASYDLLDLHKDENMDEQPSPVLGRPSYKEVLASFSFAPWVQSHGHSFAEPMAEPASHA